MAGERDRIHVRIAHWTTDRNAILAVRRRVFVDEQGVDLAVEIDGLDPQCNHVLATTATLESIATGRIKPCGQIGRMAVLEPYRRQGVGSAILSKLIDIARRQQNLPQVYLHAQVSAVAFYGKHGFLLTGEEFLEAGISHVTMVREL